MKQSIFSAFSIIIFLPLYAQPMPLGNVTHTKTCRRIVTPEQKNNADSLSRAKQNIIDPNQLKSISTTPPNNTSLKKKKITIIPYQETNLFDQETNLFDYFFKQCKQIIKSTNFFLNDNAEIDQEIANNLIKNIGSTLSNTIAYLVENQASARLIEDKDKPCEKTIDDLVIMGSTSNENIVQADINTTALLGYMIKILIKAKNIFKNISNDKNTPDDRINAVNNALHIIKSVTPDEESSIPECHFNSLFITIPTSEKKTKNIFRY